MNPEFRPLSNKEPLTLVTLWRPYWGETQQRVLNWLVEEKLPVGTLLLWTAEADSEPERRLEAAWAKHFECHPSEYEGEILATPQQQYRSEAERHALVAALYSEVLMRVQSEYVLFVEDDVLPQSTAIERLVTALSHLPQETAAVMGAYRSRQRPESVCAHDLDGHYIPWKAITACDDDSPAQRDTLIPSRWVAGGLTLYRSNEIRACLPMEICRQCGWIMGWDMTLAKKLLARGNKLYVHTGVRGAHLCPEVVRSFPEDCAGSA